MKKILCAFLTLALFCAVGAGCRPNIIDKPDDEYEVNLNVDKNISETLTILVPSNDGGLEESYIEALKPGFKEMFPNVEIKLDRRTISDAKYAESISSAIASSNVPDLFYTNTVFYYYLVSKNCVVSLEPYYEATKKAGTLDLEADYYNSFFNMSTYENKRYVVPRSMDSVVTYYNTEILQAAGIDPETDERFSNDWTWEDLVSVCYDLNAYFSSEEGKAAGYGNAFALHADFDWEAVFNAMMLSYGAEVFDGEGKVAVESENMKTMAKMIRELAEAGRILRTSTSGSTFGNGNCAFHFSSLGPARMDLNAAGVRAGLRGRRAHRAFHFGQLGGHSARRARRKKKGRLYRRDDWTKRRRAQRRMRPAFKRARCGNLPRAGTASASVSSALRRRGIGALGLNKLHHKRFVFAERFFYEKINFLFGTLDK